MTIGRIMSVTISGDKNCITVLSYGFYTIRQKTIKVKGYKISFSDTNTFIEQKTDISQ